MRAAFEKYMEGVDTELGTPPEKKELPREVRIADDWWKSLRGEKTDYTCEYGGRKVNARRGILTTYERGNRANEIVGLALGLPADASDKEKVPLLFDAAESLLRMGRRDQARSVVAVLKACAGASQGANKKRLERIEEGLK